MEFKGFLITDIQDESDADPTADATNAVFEIPAGTWDISLEFYGNQPPSQNTFLGFYKIQSGVDDVEEFASNNRQHQFFGTAILILMLSIGLKNMMLCLIKLRSFICGLVMPDAPANRIAGYFRIEKVR